MTLKTSFFVSQILCLLLHYCSCTSWNNSLKRVKLQWFCKWDISASFAVNKPFFKISIQLWSCSITVDQSITAAKISCFERLSGSEDIYISLWNFGCFLKWLLLFLYSNKIYTHFIPMCVNDSFLIWVEPLSVSGSICMLHNHETVYHIFVQLFFFFFWICSPEKRPTQRRVC